MNSYEQFFEKFSKEDFFQFGLDNLITIPKAAACEQWAELSRSINCKEASLYIRKMGRDGIRNNQLKGLYESVFGLNINFDPSNNRHPSKLLQKLTGYKKHGPKSNIANYQVSHVFGRTKNVYAFTAPWNIVFLPKLLDPLTGHEAKGDFVKEFQERFESRIFNEFEYMIKEFNETMQELYTDVEKHLDLVEGSSQLKKEILGNFEPIQVS